MPFITQGKTNWKYIIIVLILAVIVGMITWQYLSKPQPWFYLIELTENETKKFLGDESKWGDIKIELRDIQGLFGGRNISISGKGETTVEIATFGSEGLDIKTYNLLLSESEIKEMINIFIENDFITITTKERSGIPDETRPKIILINAEGNQYKIAVWGNDLQENDRFLNIYQKLLLIEKKAETTNWKNYSYKNMSFQYPSQSWVVIFNSTVANQPNGFDISIVKESQLKSIQPNELNISTYDDRSGTLSPYIFSPERRFTFSQTGDSYIQFTIGDTPIYAGCAYYTEDEDTFNICNQIINTIKIK